MVNTMGDRPHYQGYHIGATSLQPSDLRALLEEANKASNLMAKEGLNHSSPITWHDCFLQSLKNIINREVIKRGEDLTITFIYDKFEEHPNSISHDHIIFL